MGLSSDRTKDSEENGLKFVNVVLLLVVVLKLTEFSFSNSITAVANNAGIEFTPKSNGKFTIAYKISKGKKLVIFLEKL